ncbi:MAG: zinc dependent phospholipase C family protein [Desulfotomaculales bacterium]
MKLSLAALARPLASFPRQILGASSTHVFCNRQARLILFNDGYRQVAQLFNRYANQLDKGVVWADRLWRSTTHHYDPFTGRGFWFLTSGAEKCRTYFQKAFTCWRRGKHARAMFFLGAAAHLVQDACVPHHACCQMFDGHLEYEKWAKENKHNFRVDSGGLYNRADTPEGWVAANARTAREYYRCVKSPGSDEDYHEATAVLLVLAQRSTAGFFYYGLKRLLSEEKGRQAGKTG